MALEVNGQSISGISLDNKPIRLIYKDEINQKNLLFSDLAPIDANLMITDALGKDYNNENSEPPEINFSYPYSYKFKVGYYDGIINPTFSIKTILEDKDSEDEKISFEVSEIETDEMKNRTITITLAEGTGVIADYPHPIQITLTLKGDNNFEFGKVFSHPFEYDNNIFNFKFI